MSSKDTTSKEEDSKATVRGLNESLAQESTVKQLWNILPSYYMYNTTINRTLDTQDPPNYEDANSTHSGTSGTGGYPGTLSSSLNSVSLHQSRDNLDYAPSGSTSATSAATAHAAATDLSESDDTTNTNFIVADESTGHWQETILNNVHKLKNLTFSNNKVSKAIKQTVYFTKDISEAGVKPTIVDPTKIEYEQGCYIHGFVIIENTLDKPIPFDMFYVLLEGNFMIDNPKDVNNPIIYKRFLEMFDLSASWNDVHVHRLTSELDSGFVCPDLIDPLDGCHLAIQLGRLIKPGERYKRFFTFRVPERLLDSECSTHTLSSHVELPPTMGTARYENYQMKNKVNDFAFVDAAVSYSVMTRFIGKRSLYHVDEDLKDIDDTKLINHKGDEYIILNESNSFLRIVPNYTPLSDSLSRMKSAEQTLLHRNMTNRLEEHIKNGNKLLDLLEKGDFDESIKVSEDISAAEMEFAKLRQKYTRGCHDLNDDDKKTFLRVPSYSVVVPIEKQKKSLSSSFLSKSKSSKATGSTMKGALMLYTPKTAYHINYIAPPIYRSERQLRNLTDLRDTWLFSVPIELQFAASSTLEPYIPSFKFVQATFSILSLKSDREPIPLELKHDLIYTQKQYPPLGDINAIICGAEKDPDTFAVNIQEPFKKLSTKLYKCLKALPTDNFKVEMQLVEDLKLMCYTQSKTINLSVNDISISEVAQKSTSSIGSTTAQQSSVKACKALDQIKWKPSDEKVQGQVSMVKLFNVNVNLESATHIGMKPTGPVSDEYTFIPDFQSCQTARFYCLKLLFVTLDNHVISVKVPVRIIYPE